MFELELRERASHAPPLRENTYDFAAGAGAAVGTHHFCRSHANALRAPLLHLRVTILQPERSARTLVLETCKFSAEALRERTSRATSSRASGHALRVLLYLKLANFQPELRECTSRATVVLTICDFAAAPLKMLFANYFGTENLQFVSRSLYLQFAISQPRLWKCSSRATLVLKTCDLSAGAAGARFSHYFCTYSFSLRFCRRASGKYFCT